MKKSWVLFKKLESWVLVKKLEFIFFILERLILLNFWVIQEYLVVSKDFTLFCVVSKKTLTFVKIYHMVIILVLHI